MAVGAGAILRQSRNLAAKPLALSCRYHPLANKAPEHDIRCINGAANGVRKTKHTFTPHPRGLPMKRGDIRSGRMEQHLEDQLVVALRDLAEV